MIRKIAVFFTALACAAGLSLAGAGSATAAVSPVSGTYNGVDHAGAVVSFSFNGTQISSFKVGNISIGGVHVGQGKSEFHETCGNGYCIKGHWLLNNHVEGFWKRGGTHEWHSFSASTSSFHPYAGPYMGQDQTGLRIHFRYSSGHVRAFTWDHNLIGDAGVSGTHHFASCGRTMCFQGHWQTEYYVVGHWRYVNEPHNWHAWDANAYSA